MKKRYWAVTVNVPGYLPDSPDSNGYFDNLEEALDFAHFRMADYPEFEWNTEGDGSWYGDNGDGAELALEINEISREQYEQEIEMQGQAEQIREEARAERRNEEVLYGGYSY